MKAAILEKLNSPLVIADVDLCELLHGQVLVRVLMSGVCGAQLQEIAGHKGNANYVPHLLGHEGCGIVEDTGQGVTKVKKGDKVVMHWRKGNGIESDCPTYIYKGKKISSGRVTTFSEYSVVSENRVTAVPQDVPDKLCTLLGCSLSTALGTINNEAAVIPGESVMIVGAGGLGVNLIKAAQVAGASPIIVVDIHESKKEMCESLGVDLFINAKKENIQDRIFKSFEVKEIDVIVDTSGNKKSLDETIPLLSGVGRYVMVGQLKPGESIEIKNANHLFGGSGKTIKATQGGRFFPDKDIPRYIKLYQEGLLNINGLITHEIRLDQINEAIDLVRDGKAGRVLIEM